jgi:hypothetical protein
VRSGSLGAAEVAFGATPSARESIDASSPQAFNTTRNKTTPRPPRDLRARERSTAPDMAFLLGGPGVLELWKTAAIMCKEKTEKLLT